MDTARCAAHQSDDGLVPVHHARHGRTCQCSRRWRVHGRRRVGRRRRRRGTWTPLGLPQLLAQLVNDLRAHDTALFDQQADPTIPRGGWLDVDQKWRAERATSYLVDFFAVNGNARIFDFSERRIRRRYDAIAPRRRALQPATQTCGYNQWHIDTLIQSPNVGTIDGMSFSPDGTQLAFELLDPNGRSRVYIATVASMMASSPSPPAAAFCLTCGIVSNNDGVRWRPGDAATLLFVSNVDHPYAIGGDGAGFGQELYSIHADGTQATRLTTSDEWSTNYHANWSPDGNHIVWGRTENRTWDVMVADFATDATGMRLENTRRITNDTTWWETHGFTPDNNSVITTNTRAGLLETDLYAINLATGARTRLTNDPTWDEHGHVSPDGSQISWIAGRWNQDSIVQLTGAQLSPVYDFWWIIPGIDFAFVNRPAGFSTELTAHECRWLERSPPHHRCRGVCGQPVELRRQAHRLPSVVRDRCPKPSNGHLRRLFLRGRADGLAVRRSTTSVQAMENEGYL